MSKKQRCIWSALLLAYGLLTASAHAATDSPDAANEAAFAALLSLDDSGADWGTSWPEGFEPGNDPVASERNLIDWLEARRRSINLNAYGHQGTLLLHAIRMGLDETAYWLLEHGAAPNLKTQGSTGGPVDPNPDALSLAIMYRRWNVFDALMETPFYRRQSKASLSLRYWPFAFQAPERLHDVLPEVDPVTELRKRLPPPAGEDARCINAFADNPSLHGWLSASAPSRPSSQHPPIVDAVRSCRAHVWSGQDQAKRFETLNGSDLEAADRLLADDEYLFLYLIPTLKSVHDVDRLLTLQLRHPFERSAFMKTLFQRVLGVEDWALSREVRDRLLAAVPLAALQETLSDKAVLYWWVKYQREGSPEDFALGLDKVPADLRSSSAARIYEAAAYYLNSMPAANWPALLERVPPPSSFNFLILVPVNFWPLLFERGYQPSLDDVKYWLVRQGGNIDPQAWNLLKARAPALEAHAIGWLLTGQRGCATRGIQPEAVKSIKIVVALGVRPTPEPSLPPSCVRRSDPTVVADLLALGVIETPKPLDRANPRFVLAATNCRSTPDDRWFELLQGEVLQSGYGRKPVEAVQMIEEPGSNTCALLVSFRMLDGWDFDQGSSFDSGNDALANCAVVDSQAAAEVWRLINGRLTRGEAGVNPAPERAFQIRDTETGNLYLLVRPMGEVMCMAPTQPYQLVEWTLRDGQRVLNRSNPQAPESLAIADQCDLNEAASCFGVYDPSEQPDDDASGSVRTPAWDEDQSLGYFLDHRFPDRKRAWLSAVLANDRLKLKALEKAGISPHWLLDALLAVSQSDMPLPDKRRRIAWLFRNANRLQAALYSPDGDGEFIRRRERSLASLVPWMPPEDWRPLEIAIRASEPAIFQMLLDAANDQNLLSLYRRLLKARGGP